MREFPLWAWAVFGSTLLVFLIIDLYVHRGRRGESRASAIVWSVIWIVVGLGFVGFVWSLAGRVAAMEYLAAYAIEKSLSLDNLFVFLIIFQSLGIPKEYQRTALTWGIFGALVFRAVFVFIGAAALNRAEWMAYIFGAILFYAAYHAVRDDPSKRAESKLVSWLSDRLPVTQERETNKFLVRENGRWRATPLLVAVLGLEASDIVFAIDSVPAALSFTRREFIVYSSNAFAILGLRSLYIVLAHTIAELKYLGYGLAGVLAFAGLKMVLPEDWLHIPPLVSVGVIVTLIATAVGASLWLGDTSQRS